MPEKKQPLREICFIILCMGIVWTLIVTPVLTFVGCLCLTLFSGGYFSWLFDYFFCTAEGWGAMSFVTVTLITFSFFFETYFQD